MNIFHRITRQTLLKNRTRTVVTVIGIILSAAMFTAVTTFISSIQNFMLEQSIASQGDWYGSVRAVQSDTVERIAADERVTQLARAQVVGYVPLETVEYEQKPYLYVLGADETFFSSMPIHLVEGRLPVNACELLLPEHLAWTGGIRYEVGDVLTLPLSYRTQEGETVFQRTPYREGETLLDRGERTFTVVGICAEPGFEDFSYPGYTAFTGFSADAPADTVIDCYFKLRDARATQAFLDALDVEGASTNRDVLMYMGISGYASFMAVFAGLAAILIGLIVFGSVSLIYNAFSISVSERTRQFGLLISIGATKKQIRGSVIYEALLLSVIGIPIGVLCGMLGIGVTLYLLSDTAFLEGMHLHASAPAIVIACVIALITVLISARIPARRAMRVTAIDAIRQTTDVQVKAGREPSYRLTYRLFGLPGVLAMKHFRRNRRRYRATIVSLFMSIVLFISASAFSRYLTDSVTGVFNKSDVDLLVTYHQQDAEEQPPVEALDALLRADPGVTALTAVCSEEMGTLFIPEENAHPELATVFPAVYLDNGERACPASGAVIAIDDASFRAFLEEQGLEPDPFFDPAQPRALVSGSLSYVDYGQKRIFEMKTLRSLPEKMSIELFDSEREALSEEERSLIEAGGEQAEDFRYTVDIVPGAVVEELPFGLNGRSNNDNAVLVLYPRGNLPQTMPVQGDSVRYFLRSPDHAATTERLNAALREKGFGSTYVYDYAQSAENERSLILVMNVFSYGFITLISLIAVANVFNTISTNIRLRRREFAMLKSVGMTNGGFHRMMNLECLLYGCKALLYGLPVSLLITWLIYQSISNGFVSTFYVPVMPILIAVGSVFLVVFVTMLYAMRKIERDNPIDALKNENL